MFFKRRAFLSVAQLRKEVDEVDGALMMDLYQNAFFLSFFFYLKKRLFTC